MNHVQHQTFDKVPAVLLRMFADRTFVERKYAELGMRDVCILAHEKSGDSFRIHTRYKTKSSVSLPDFAKKFVPEDITIEQEDRWDLARQIGRIEFDLHGIPVKIAADMTLFACGTDGAVNTLKWSIVCGLPLIGGKLEKLMLSDIEAKSEAELVVSRRILSDY